MSSDAVFGLRRFRPRPGDHAVERSAEGLTAVLNADARHRPSVLAHHIPEVLLAAELIRLMPRIDVATSETPEGAALRSALTSRFSLNRTARPGLAVLETPEDRSVYLDDPARQQLRTRMSQGRRLGLTFDEVTDPSRRVELARRLLDERAPTRVGMPREDWFLQFRTDRAFFAFDAEGEVRALTWMAADGSAAYMRSALATVSRKYSSTVRYCLHEAACARLAADGVRYLWADSPLLITPGLQRFQRTLGYECATPRIRREP